jgi:hypothetical protein
VGDARAVGLEAEVAVALVERGEVGPGAEIDDGEADPLFDIAGAGDGEAGVEARGEDGLRRAGVQDRRRGAAESRDPEPGLVWTGFRIARRMHSGLPE